MPTTIDMSTSPDMPTSTNIPTSIDSFQARVKSAVNGKYHSCMRRSLQSVALYEANRCLVGRYGKLRPFQRKWALLATAVDLLNTLDFLTDEQRQEIMYRTNSSKEPLAPELAWRRMKLITREIGSTILPQAEELIKENKDINHDEFCELLLQKLFDERKKEALLAKPDSKVMGGAELPKPYSPLFEFNHNNVFSVYRIYYRGTKEDPNIFLPVSPMEVKVPNMKPSDAASVAGATNNAAPSLPLEDLTIVKAKSVLLSDEERRALLKEVKDHTELLNEFIGVVPNDELAERKRALYAALPPVPSPVGVGKKHKQNNAIVSATAKPTAMNEDENWGELSV